MSTLASELLSSTRRGAGDVLSAVIRERSASLGDETYIEHARESRLLSFRDLDVAVDQWAVTLESASVDVGSTVGLVISDPIDFAVAFLGTIASGRWAAPLDPSTPLHGAGGLAAAAGRVQAGVICADHAAPSGLEVEWVDLGEATSIERGEVTKPGATDPSKGNAGGAVLASSGTTGAPKVVPLHQRQLLHTARCVSTHLQLTPADRGFNSLPLFHINAEVVGLMASLVAGSSLVLDDRFHRTRFWEVMAERRITWINAVPAIISRLADPRGDERIPPGIRFIRSASAPLPVATSARFETNTGIPVVETYGMTEAASQITANPVRGVRKPGSVGLPVGVELRIVAAEAPPGEAGPQVDGETVGQVEIRGPSVISAYGGGHHGDRIDVDGWLRTGDLGHFDRDGYLYLDARLDDVINRGGEKVFPREIEELILEDPAVAAVAVIGSPDPELGQVPVAFLVAHAVQSEGDQEAAASVAARVRDHLSSALVRSKRPVWLNVVHELPAGATGKVQRRSLRDGDVPVIYRLDCR
jgi:acyl-CoA synthetase (AMP-forming)/AMP-acid ligase II